LLSELVFLDFAPDFFAEAGFSDLTVVTGCEVLPVKQYKGDVVYVNVAPPPVLLLEPKLYIGPVTGVKLILCPVLAPNV